MFFPPTTRHDRIYFENTTLYVHVMLFASIAFAMEICGCSVQKQCSYPEAVTTIHDTDKVHV